MGIDEDMENVLGNFAFCFDFDAPIKPLTHAFCINPPSTTQTGMTRDEVTAIRLYFARSVDRYIERRRVMIRASQRLRNSLNGIVGGGGGDTGASTSTRDRSNTGESSSNSLLDTDESNDDDDDNNSNSNEGNNVANAAANSSNNNNNNRDGGNNNTAEGSNNESSTTPTTSTTNNNNNNEGEEILNDRLRMEDEWMSTQGPYSEFRMNLNTSNPLLLAAISGGGAAAGLTSLPATTGGSSANPLDRTPAGMFFRSRMRGGDGTGGDDDDESDMFGGGGAFTANGEFVRGGGQNGGAFNPFLGPLPSAGTDKDFVWGFILGFFVGFIMLFWVWMPTVPHKQKIGIISGISFQLGLNLLRKSSENEFVR